MQLVTGNRLRDGVVIYFAGGGRWSPAIDEARLVADETAAALLAEAQAGPVPLPAIGPVLIEAVAEAGHIRPVSLRERIRAAGPTTGPITNQSRAETEAKD
jgi:sulfite reductase (NADPH) hemoprotein beta-component